MYPQTLLDQAAKVTLVANFDRCGFVAAVMVESSPAQDEFTMAAIKAARRWRMAPPAGAEGKETWQARVPIDFDNRGYRDPDVPCDKYKVVEHPPFQPAQALAADARAVFSVDVDECGWPVSIALTESSGYASLDESAFRSLKTRHFSPNYRGGKEVFGLRSVSIDFPKPSEELLNNLSRGWKEVQVAKVEEAPDGTLDGYLPDPELIEGHSDAIRKRLKSDAIRFFRKGDSIEHYRESDTHWYVFNPPAYVSALVRRRLVSDGTKVFKVVSVRCESGVAKDCAQFEADVKGMFDRQEPLGRLINPRELMKPDAPGSTKTLTWRREER